MFIVCSVMIDLVTLEIKIETISVYKTELGALCHALALSLAHRKYRDALLEEGVELTFEICPC